MARRASRPLKELDEQALGTLALRYVERFATTRAKLVVYLRRKIRERGWSGTRPPDPQALAERFSDQGYVDDAAFALAKARGLTARGYGRRRVSDTLRQAGVAEGDGAAALDHADENKVSAALRFAERRRIGPFATAAPADPKARDKALNAMLRAGHGFALARAIVALAPGAAVDPENLAESR